MNANKGLHAKSHVCVQNQIVGGVVPNSNSMTRLAGPAIMGMGAHSLISGLEQGGSRNKQTLQV